jgi:hypothetical protein
MIDRACALAGAMFLALYATACTTTPASEGNADGPVAKPPVASPEAPRAAAGQVNQPPPGIYFAYVLDHGANTPPMAECKVLLHKDATPTEGSTTAEATLKPDKNRVLIKVPAGSYHVVEGTCLNGRRFAAAETLPAIEVAADRVTFLGEVQLIQGRLSKKKEKDTLKIDRQRSPKNLEVFDELKVRKLVGWWWLEPKT